MAAIKYRVLRGIDYKTGSGTEKRAEVGDVVSDISAKGVTSLLNLQEPAIEKVTNG